MRRQFVVTFFALLSCYVNPSYSQIVTGAFNTRQAIPDTVDGRQYNISIPNTGTIAEVTVSLDLDHPILRGLDVWLTHRNQTVILFSGQQSQLPIGGSTRLTVRYDDPDRTVTSLSKFCGQEASGDWTLEIKDSFYNDGAYGVLHSWKIEIELAQFGTLEINDEYDIRFLRLYVDAYGSFGDYGYGASPLGAYHKIESSRQGNTVYASSLMLHSEDGKESRYLTSLDSFPGQRSPSVSLVQNDDNEYDSWFSIGSLDVYLKQKLECEQPDGGIAIFRLIQDYEFKNTSDESRTYYISRYINPKFRFSSSLVEVDNTNFFLPHFKEGLDFPELYAFDSIRSSTTVSSPYVSIGARSDVGSYLDYRVDDWYHPGEKQFDEILLDERLGVYDWIKDATEWNDFDGDSITDFDKGFDVALALGATLSFNETQRVIRYVAVTQWGYASPASILSVTEGVPFEYPTVFPTPTPSPTPSPSPTSTPTPTSTPLPNEPPHWIKPLPDIRIIANQVNPNILNLEEYVHDPDTPVEDLNFTNWKMDKTIPLNVNSDNVLSCSPVLEIGDYGNVTFIVHDGVSIIEDTVRVKVSSFLTNSFRPAPPIVFTPGETTYLSSYRLNDLIVNLDDYPEGSFEWSAIQPLPEGIESVVIHDDASFTLTVNSNFAGTISSLPFIVHRLDLTETPTPTSTYTPVIPTPTLTPEPTATFTPTYSPTATSTPLPPTPTLTATPTPTYTPISTNTPTPTMTSTNTPTLVPPTPTFTPSPSPTIVPPTSTFTPIPKTPSPTLPPASTPTPSKPTATPTPGCADRFAFPKIVTSDTGMGPVDWVPIPGSEGADRVVVALYDRGGIGVYQRRNEQYVSQSLIETPAGVANLSFGDFSGDSVEDLFVLNAAQETLSVYLGDGDGGYVLGPELDLSDERLSDIYDIENGVRYQSLAVGSMNGDALSDAVVRTRDAILLIHADEGRLTVERKIEFEGITRSLKGCDLDSDGDLDVIVAVKTSSAEERVFVYQNQNGDLVLTQTLRTDLQLKGNYPDEVVASDLDGDSILDLIVLGFSGSVQRFLGKGDGTFILSSETNPFPLGEIVSFDVADLDLDGNSDLIALHRSQDGLALIAVCGEVEFGRASFSIGSFAPNGEMYVLRCVDTDEDGDPDILFTRNFEDRLVWMKNGADTENN